MNLGENAVPIDRAWREPRVSAPTPVLLDRQWRTTAMTHRVALLLGGVLLAGAVGAQTPDPKEVAAGKKLFSSKNCTKCHMAEGKGNKKLRMDGAAAKVAKLSPGEIRQWITSPAEMTAKLDHKPVNPMKKTELTEAEISALVAYMLHLRTLK